MIESCSIIKTMMVGWAMVVTAALAGNWVKGRWGWALPAVGLGLLALGMGMSAPFRLLSASLLLLYAFKGVLWRDASGPCFRFRC